MRKSELFKRLGYPKHSDVVYDVLVKTKDLLLVSHIAKQAQLPRMTVYRCLNALVSFGLVRKEKIGKRTRFTTTGAAALDRVVRIEEAASEKTIRSDRKRLEKDIPRSVRFLRGPEGIRAAFDDVVSHTKRGETFFRYTSEKNLIKVNQYLARDYRERRDKKKLERKVISNALSGNQKRSRLERFIKFIPEEGDQFQQNIIQLVYGNRISIIDLETEEVTIVENERLADFQKTIFSLLYKRL
ncbi:MAG: helix-turn-helix domain-containing protein [Candidatus Paceibacterota bacterium]